MINYESAAVPKIVEQCVIKLNNLGVLKFSSFVIFITLLYFVESSFLCRFRVESVNVFVLPPFDFCTSKIFFHQQTISYMQKRFPNEFTVRSYEYWAGQHWILSWMEENRTATHFLRSRLFTYDIKKNFNCNISLCFSKSKFRSSIGKHFYIKITACMPLASISNYVICLVVTTNNWPSVETTYIHHTHSCSESTKEVFKVWWKHIYCN